MPAVLDLNELRFANGFDRAAGYLGIRTAAMTGSVPFVRNSNDSFGIPRKLSPTWAVLADAHTTIWSAMAFGKETRLAAAIRYPTSDNLRRWFEATI